MKPWGTLKTAAVHGGATTANSRAIPVVSPLHVSAVSYFEDAETLDASFDGQDFVYGRINAQNTSQLEEALATLEGAEATAVFGSGMAALRAVFEAQTV